MQSAVLHPTLHEPLKHRDVEVILEVRGLDRERIMLQLGAELLVVANQNQMLGRRL